MINNTNGISHTSGVTRAVCFAEVTHFDTVVAFVLPDQEFLFQRIQVFRHKDELLSGRILAFMILHGQAFFYPSVSTFIIASFINYVILKYHLKVPKYQFDILG